MQKRLFDVGWSDESKCQACHKEEGTEEPGGAEDKGCVGTSTTKAQVGNVEIDRERARMLQRLESSRAVGQWSRSPRHFLLWFMLIFLGF